MHFTNIPSPSSQPWLLRHGNTAVSRHSKSFKAYLSLHPEHIRLQEMVYCHIAVHLLTTALSCYLSLAFFVVVQHSAVKATSHSLKSDGQRNRAFDNAALRFELITNVIKGLLSSVLALRRFELAVVATPAARRARARRACCMSASNRIYDKQVDEQKTLVFVISPWVDNTIDDGALFLNRNLGAIHAAHILRYFISLSMLDASLSSFRRRICVSALLL